MIIMTTLRISLYQSLKFLNFLYRALGQTGTIALIIQYLPSWIDWTAEYCGILEVFVEGHN